MAKKTENKKIDSDKDKAKKRLSKFMTRLSSAKAHESQERKQWKEILKVLEFKRDVVTGSDTVTKKIKYPLLWGAYDNYLSNLTSTPPQTMIEAEGKEDLVKKVYWKGILDYKKRKLRIDDLKEQFVQSLIATGKAVYKVGRMVEVIEEEQEYKDEQTGATLKKNVEAIKTNESYIENIDPNKVYISPETKYKGPVLGEECPYIIEEMIKTPDYIKSRFDVELSDEELEIITTEDDDVDNKDRTQSADQDKDDMKRVRLYAYYGECDGHPNYEVLFTTKRILKERPFPYKWGNKKPYIYALNFKKFFKAKARGSLDAVMDLDLEYNEHMNKLRTILRRLASPKWAKTKGTQVDEEALLDPDIGLLVDESQPNSFRPIEGPKIDPALFDKATSVEQLFQLITGIVYGSTAIKEAGTATGQGIVEKGADIKIGRVSRVIERAQEELEIMLLQLEQQYAPQEGMSIRVTGPDIINMIQDKKFLHQQQVQIFEQKQAQIQSGELVAQNGMVMTADGQPAGRLMQTPPIDEYENFQISSDGRSVYTSYTREDIQGEFELTVISQSSNRTNKVVQAQQIINALTQTQPGEEKLRQALWRRLMANYNWDEVLKAVEQIQSQQLQPQAPMQGGLNPTEQSVTSGANKPA